MNFEIPLRHIHDNIYVLELFHGPSLNFKDVGTRFMARLLSYLRGSDNREINIITATSGGSGGAIANGYFDVPGVHVYVLFPHNKLSKTLESQFTTLGHNITPIEVSGSYNDCQDLVRAAFADSSLTSKMRITSANSINIARLLPQTFYYFYAYAQLSARLDSMPKVSFAIPCGNLGNLVSAVISKKMGLGINKIVAATGPNCDLSRFLASGFFNSFEAGRSIMPAMDVATPNNLPRLLPLFDNSLDELNYCISTKSINEAQVAETIRSVYHDYGYMLDPHSATAYYALSSSLSPGEAGIVTATAHPAKSKRVIDYLLNTDIPLPASLAPDNTRKRNVEKIPAIYSRLRNLLLSNA